MKIASLVWLILMPLGSFAQKLIQIQPYTDVLALSELTWKVKFGDNPNWKNVSIDDNSWKLTQQTTWSLDDKIFMQEWEGTLWLRLTFEVDESLKNLTHSLTVWQQGASEIYLDGVLIKQLGQVGYNKETEKIYRTTNEAVDLPFDDKDVHILAIKYTNHTFTQAFKMYGKKFKKVGLGMQLKFFRGQDNEYDYFTYWSIQSSEAKVFIFGIYAVLSLLHLLLYFFFVKEQANLWYGLFTGLLAIYNLCYLYKATSSIGIEFFIFLELLSSLAVFWYLCSYLVFLYSIFQPELISLTKWLYLIGLGFFVANCWTFFNHDTVLYESIILIVCIVFVVIESLRIINVAFKRRISGRWFLGGGAMLLGLTFMIGVVAVQIVPLIEIGSPVHLFNEWLSTLCMPFAMLLFLAQKNSQNKQSLEKQLLQIQALSIEKQTILENQKKELEKQVEEKTYLYKEANQELTSITEELKQQTEVLSNQKENLEALQITKDLMISAVNHDLRNALNPILNYSRADYPEIDKDKRLYLIYNNAQNMFSLINDIMDVYRADKLTLKPLPNMPYQTIEKAIEVIIEARENLPEIINEVPSNLKAVFENKYIQRVFENLLSNAIKYTFPKEEGGKIRFFAQPSHNENTFICLGIEDNGEGIPEDKFEEIFKPFTNPNARSIGEAQSVGIGLTFCKTIIEAHGSKIEIISTVGKGTIFSFDLPLYQDNIYEDIQELNLDTSTLEDTLQLTHSEQQALEKHKQLIENLELATPDMEDALSAIDTFDKPYLAAWKKALIKVNEEYDEIAFKELLNRY